MTTLQDAIDVIRNELDRKDKLKKSSGRHYSSFYRKILEAAQKWQAMLPRPWDERPNDGRMILAISPAGYFICPSVNGPEMPKEEQRKMAKEIYDHSGEWPNVKFNPTHFIPLDALPEVNSRDK